MLAAPLVARLGISTASVMSKRPSMKAPVTTPARSDVSASRVMRHRRIAIIAGSSDQMPK